MDLKKIRSAIVSVMFHSTDLKPVPPVFIPTLVILLALSLVNLILSVVLGLGSSGYAAQVCLFAGIIGFGLVIIKAIRFQNSV
jgi:hypothetical protein